MEPSLVGRPKLTVVIQPLEEMGIQAPQFMPPPPSKSEPPPQLSYSQPLCSRGNPCEKSTQPIIKKAARLLHKGSRAGFFMTNSKHQGFAGHLLRLGQLENLQHSRGDIRQASALARLQGYPTTAKGTGLVVWAVKGEPSVSTIRVGVSMVGR